MYLNFKRFKYDLLSTTSLISLIDNYIDVPYIIISCINENWFKHQIKSKCALMMEKEDTLLSACRYDSSNHPIKLGAGERVCAVSEGRALQL